MIENENVKSDANCIIKAFENNLITIIKEDPNIYLFKAADIGKLLDIVNIRSSIQKFDETERCVREVDTGFGVKEIIYLTSRGIYRLLYNSTKELAKKFRNWVADIIDDIIFNNSNELRLQLDDKNKQLENVELDKDKLREKTILDQCPDDVQCIYYGLTDNVSSKGEQLIKFGCSNFLSDRVRRHRKTYQNFRLVAAFRVQNKTQVESALKNNIFLSSIRRELQLKWLHNELLLSSEIEK